ncbi:hypothetical protein OHV05_26825 [Kitasatospora sp. NBC_00070]|uniref:hypothetical protein n=1 Tax=Kitasatospora sp. NBC_00070 TaxID=2975962 RepID=UPI00324A34D9
MTRCSVDVRAGEVGLVLVELTAMRYETWRTQHSRDDCRGVLVTISCTGRPAGTSPTAPQS